MNGNNKKRKVACDCKERAKCKRTICPCFYNGNECTDLCSCNNNNCQNKVNPSLSSYYEIIKVYYILIGQLLITLKIYVHSYP